MCLGVSGNIVAVIYCCFPSPSDAFHGSSSTFISCMQRMSPHHPAASTRPIGSHTCEQDLNPAILTRKRQPDCFWRAEILCTLSHRLHTSCSLCDWRETAILVKLHTIFTNYCMPSYEVCGQVRRRLGGWSWVRKRAE